MSLASALVDAGYAAVDAGDRIVALDMSDPAVGDADLEILETIPNVKLLILSRTEVTDDGLRHVAALHDLNDLQLSEHVTDAGLRHLASLTKLERLGTTDSHVTFAGVRRLFVDRQGRSLVDALRASPFMIGTGSHGGPPYRIDLRRSGVTDAALGDLVAIDELDTVLLAGTGVTDGGAAHLAKIAGLRVLWLSGEAITGATLEALGDVPTLRVLWLPETGITNDDLDHLAGLPALEVLNVAGTAADDGAVPALERIASLATLVIDNTALSRESVDRLVARHPGIAIHGSQARALAAVRGRKRVLDHLVEGQKRPEQSAGVSSNVHGPFELLQIFGDEHFEIADFFGLSDQWIERGGRKEVVPGTTDARLDHLRDLPTVTFASLGGSKASEALARAKDLPHLTRLILQGSDIDDEALRHLAGLEKLEELGFYDTAITDEGLAHLADLTGLRKLTIHMTDVDEGLAHLAGLALLQELHLFRTKTTDATLPSLAGMKSLKLLRFEQTGVTAEGVASLAAALPETRVDADVLRSNARGTGGR